MSDIHTTTPDTTTANRWESSLDPSLITLVPYQYAKRHEVVAAFRESEQTHVLAANRPTVQVITELRRQLRSQLVFHQIEPNNFERVLRRAYDLSQSEAHQMVDDMGDEIDLEMLAHELPETTDLLEASNDAPIVRLINALLTQAIRETASDIHLEAFEQRSVVRFRVDGVLRDVVQPQRALHGALVSRLKVMAKLDIAEKRLPQDGRISLRVGDHAIDVRVSTLPTQHGERVVLRILDKQGSRLDLQNLGMMDLQRKEFDRLIHSPHGIILVTGPTGSGKTTTLYAGLSTLNRRELNILTVEDPIEYDLDGVGQTQVHAKIDMTFANGLRSILRQDPDVVLVGEIRDVETADIAVQASLTGHLVLSTLHTNTAIGAVTRLIDMGVESFLISSSLIGVLAQRLVRRLCMQCRIPFEPNLGEKRLLEIEPNDEATIYRAAGCEHCDHSGYRGRTGIYELILVDDQLRGMIHDNAGEDDMLKYLETKRLTIAQDGYAKVTQGVSTIDEVMRVTRDY